MSNTGTHGHTGQSADSMQETVLTTRPIPGSHKVYVEGTQAGVRVPFREIPLSAAVEHGHLNGGRNSQAEERGEAGTVIVYDTSGPYTDPAVAIDVRHGIAPHRVDWITARGDVEELAESSSDYGRLRELDASLAGLRFPHRHRPLRARAGHNVSQMHYARRGLITP